MTASTLRQGGPLGAGCRHARARQPEPAGQAFRCRPPASAGQAYRCKKCDPRLRDCHTPAAGASQARVGMTVNTGRTSLSMSTACIGRRSLSVQAVRVALSRLPHCSRGSIAGARTGRTSLSMRAHTARTIGRTSLSMLRGHAIGASATNGRRGAATCRSMCGRGPCKLMAAKGNAPCSHGGAT